ncbi:lysoplasmalogenase family protein [Sungkyunkwania multivorans]|uniref:Lysoplasmalogenase family protein n=1 Tax=Sungkyunkwania multivorans TaxID=1173618 RepID=A0ABW3CST5_9FLAO
MKNQGLFTIIYMVILATDLVCSNVESLRPFRVITKPSVISSLFFFFLYNSGHLVKQQRNFMLAALVFFFLGDLFFLNYYDNLFFMIGFGFFFLAYLMYVFAFQFNISYHLGRLVILSVIIMIYAFWFLKKTLMGLGDYFIPIIIFMVVIFSSLQSAFFRWNQVPQKSFYLVFVGALIYLGTQTLIAYNKFVGPVPYENFFTMFTYGIAQYCIVIGILIQQRRPVEFDQ